MQEAIGSAAICTSSGRPFVEPGSASWAAPLPPAVLPALCREVTELAIVGSDIQEAPEVQPAGPCTRSSQKMALWVLKATLINSEETHQVDVDLSF